MLIGSKLRLSMIVKNEENRYLRRVLESAKAYIDDAVIIDDGSSDGTVSLCREVLRGVPHVIVENEESRFSDEWILRRQQWDESIKGDPEWILFLDADEIFEDSFSCGVKELTENEGIDLYSFRLYDFWDEEHYREDDLWCSHQFYRPFLLRYIKDFPYQFNQRSQHSGRMPQNVFQLRNDVSHYRVKHYGWANQEDRVNKYNRYLKLDPDGLFGSMPQYESILDPNPNLVAWTE